MKVIFQRDFSCSAGRFRSGPDPVDVPDHLKSILPSDAVIVGDEKQQVRKPKRARKAGKFAADDKSTPDINEAWEGGKSPAELSADK